MPAENPPTESSAWDQADDGTLAPPKKKRRKWPWVIGGILLLLVVLVLLAPTIASTAPVRSMIVGKINDNLNGKLAVSDWSIGWTSGVTLNGVKIDDERGTRVLEVNQIRLPMSLIDAARGNYDLGEVVIDQPNIVKLEFYPDGTNNLEKLAKDAGDDERKPKDENGKLPDVKGKITIRQLRGTILAPDTPQVEIEPSDISINIVNINSPIENDIKLKYRVGQSPAGTILASGKIDAVGENEVQLAELSADQTIEIKGADLSAAQPFLKQQQITLAGVASGGLSIKVEGLREGGGGVNDGSVDGQFTVKDFLFGGAPLKGDQYKSSLVSLPINVTTTARGDDTQIQIKTFKLETDQLAAEITGKATQQALANLAAQKPPGSDGQLAVALNTKDLPGLVNPLRNAIGLQKDVQISSGELKTRIDVTLAPDRAVVKQNLDLHASGTNAGKPVTLEPVHLDSSATVIPAGGAIPDLRDITLNLASAFAKASGGGASLANLDVKGNVDLARLRQQIAQFVELGELNFSGTGDFAVTSKGDLTTAGGTADVTTKLTLTNFAARGLADQQITQDQLLVDASAKIVRGAQDFIERIPSATVTFRSGSAQSPVIDLAANATNITLTNLGVEKFDVTKLTIPDLARAQQQFAAVVDLPVVAAGGSLGGRISGSYQNDKLIFDEKIQLRNVTLEQIDEATKQRKPLLQNENQDIIAAGTVAMPKDQPIEANLSALSVATSFVNISLANQQHLLLRIKNGAVGGSGQLQVTSDLKRLNDVLMAMREQPAVTMSAGQLRSGALDATVKLETTPDAGTNIQLTGGIDNLSVTTNDRPIENEKVTLALAATTDADFSGVTVSSAAVHSSFAKTNITDAKLLLKTPAGATPTLFEMLQSAKVEIAIPDLGKTQAVAEAFAPPAPATPPTPDEKPMPPLVVSGGAAVKLEIARDAGTNISHVRSAQIGASKVSLARGQRRFDFQQPINVNLAADIATAGENIEQIKVTQLAGDLANFAKLAMPSPITVTNLSGDVPNANGQIALSGNIEPLTQMLSVIENADPMPYRGTFDMSQNVTTQSNKVQLAGEMNVNQLVVLQEGKPVFTEDKLVVANDLVADTSSKTATINTLNLRMLSSQAAGVIVKGTVKDWETQRQLEGVTCDLSYDLEKIWQIVKPMLSAEQQQTYADLKIVGKEKRTFTVAGSYPANVPFEQAIRSLNASGAIAFDQLYTQGLDVRSYELPITLQNGQIITVYANKPKEERVPKPALANGTGSLDLGSIVVDLTKSDPTLSIGKNQQLMKDVPLNPVMADALGKYAAFIFKDASAASGLMSVTVLECENVPLGELLGAANSPGRAKMVVAIKDLRLDGPVSRAIAQVAQLGKEGIVGELRDSSIGYANGQTQSDIAIYITRKGVPLPLQFSGGIGLNNFDLRNTVISIPPQLLGSDEISAAFPQGMQLPITGTVDKYQIADWQTIVRKNLPGVVGGVLDDLLSGKKRDEQPAATQPGQQPAKREPTIGDVIDILGGKKKEKK